MDEKPTKSAFVVSTILITILVVGCICGIFHQQKSFITSETEELDVDKTAAHWSRCPLPRIAMEPATSTSLAWNYYNALVDENSKTAVTARSFFSVPQNKKHDNKMKPRIPHRLIFTHKDNLLDCSNSASNSTPPQLYNLAENVKATLNAYSQIWPDLQFAFLTNDDCIDSINQTEPGLIPYFDGLKGKFSRLSILPFIQSTHLLLFFLVEFPYLVQECTKLIYAVRQI